MTNNNDGFADNGDAKFFEEYGITKYQRHKITSNIRKNQSSRIKELEQQLLDKQMEIGRLEQDYNDRFAKMFGKSDAALDYENSKLMDRVHMLYEALKICIRIAVKTRAGKSEVFKHKVLYNVWLKMGDSNYKS
jgi:hypothetical protein